MKNNPDKFRKISIRRRQPQAASAGFTLTELVVVLGAIALVAATLLPALASTKIRDQLAMCTANCRQWGVGMMTYASDHNSYFPNEQVPRNVGGNPWDVANSYINDTAPYGLNNPKMWFCPVRSWAYAQDNAVIQQQLGHPLASVTNDVAYLFAYEGRWPDPDFEELAGGDTYGGLTVASAGYEPWVKRSFLGGAGTPFPSIYVNGVNGAINPNRNSPYEWLQKSSDPHAAVMPILTDIIVSSVHSVSVLNALGLKAVAPGQGHPAGPSLMGSIQSNNLTFGDGHVETHQAGQIFWRYPANGANYTSFY
jgi:hypothetical protein